jgi:hypothetical protein
MQKYSKEHRKKIAVERPNMANCICRAKTNMHCIYNSPLSQARTQATCNWAQDKVCTDKSTMRIFTMPGTQQKG